MSILNSIAHSYKGREGQEGQDYTAMSVAEKSIFLQDELISICLSLAEVNKITDDMKVDVDYLVTVVGSYLLGLQEGELDNSTEPPRKLFEEALFPALAAREEIVVEAIEEEDNDESDDSTNIEGNAPQETPDLRA